MDAIDSALEQLAVAASPAECRSHITVIEAYIARIQSTKDALNILEAVATHASIAGRHIKPMAVRAALQILNKLLRQYPSLLLSPLLWSLLSRACEGRGGGERRGGEGRGYQRSGEGRTGEGSGVDGSDTTVAVPGEAGYPATASIAAVAPDVDSDERSQWPEDCVVRAIRSIMTIGDTGSRGISGMIPSMMCQIVDRFPKISPSGNDLPASFTDAMEAWQQALACIDDIVSMLDNASISGTLFSVILQLLETVVFVFSPTVNSTDAGYFLQHIKVADPAWQASQMVSIDMFAEFSDWHWLERYSCFPQPLLARATRYFHKLGKLLVGGAGVSNLFRGVKSAAPLTVSMLSEVIVKQANIGYCRPWYAEPAVRSILDFCTKPPSHLCVVTTGHAFVLNPTLHSIMRQSLAKLCSSPACNHYGTSCNQLLSALCLPAVPVCPYFSLPSLPTYLAAQQRLSPLHDDEESDPRNEIYTDMQGTVSASGNTFTAAFAVDSHLSSTDLMELMLSNLRHMPELTDQDRAEFEPAATTTFASLAAALVSLHHDMERKNRQARPQAAHRPGPEELGSTDGSVWDHPAAARWQKSLESCASLGFSDTLHRVVRAMQMTWSLDEGEAKTREELFQVALPNVAPHLLLSTDGMLAPLQLLWLQSGPVESSLAPLRQVLSNVSRGLVAATQLMTVDAHDIEDETPVRIIANRIRARFPLFRLCTFTKTCLNWMYYQGSSTEALTEVAVMATRAVFNVAFATNATSMILSAHDDTYGTLRGWLLALPIVSSDMMDALLSLLDKSAGVAARARSLAAAAHGQAAPSSALPDGLVALTLLDIIMLRPELSYGLIDAAFAMCIDADCSPFTQAATLRCLVHAARTMAHLRSHMKSRMLQILHLLARAAPQTDICCLPVEAAPLDSHYTACRKLTAELQAFTTSEGGDETPASRRISLMLGNLTKVGSAFCSLEPQLTMQVLSSAWVISQRTSGAAAEPIMQDTIRVGKKLAATSGSALAFSFLHTVLIEKQEAPLFGFGTAYIQALVDFELETCLATLQRAFESPPPPALRACLDQRSFPGRMILSASVILRKLVESCVQAATSDVIANLHFRALFLLPVCCLLDSSNVDSLISAVMQCQDLQMLTSLAERFASTPYTYPAVGPDEVASLFVIHADQMRSAEAAEAPSDATKLLQEVTNCFFKPQTRSLFTSSALQGAVHRLIERAVVAAKSPSAKQPVVPLLFMRLILATGKQYRDISGQLVGMLTSLLSRCGGMVFEDVQHLEAWAGSDGPDAAPVWDGFLHVVKAFIPATWMLLQGLPEVQFRVLLSCPRETPLIERFKGVHALWASKAAAVPAHITDALGLWVKPDADIVTGKRARGTEASEDT